MWKIEFSWPKQRLNLNIFILTYKQKFYESATVIHTWNLPLQTMRTVHIVLIRTSFTLNHLKLQIKCSHKIPVQNLSPHQWNSNSSSWLTHNLFYEVHKSSGVISWVDCRDFRTGLKKFENVNTLSFKIFRRVWKITRAIKPWHNALWSNDLFPKDFRVCLVLEVRRRFLRKTHLQFSGFCVSTNLAWHLISYVK